jgi:3-oxoacyl-[acyl-carrier protein] reductase
MASSERVVVVSGGASGSGLGVAKRFAREGCQVVILGRNEDRLKQAVAEVGNAGCKNVDLRYRDQVQAAANWIRSDYGRVDVLVNATGLIKLLPVTLDLKTAEAIWDEITDSNLKSAFMMSVALSSAI